MYQLHHVVMHHCGNNRAGEDGSSTERCVASQLSPALLDHARQRVALLRMHTVQHEPWRCGKTSSSLFWLSYGGRCGLVQPRSTCDRRYRRNSLAHFLLYWLRFALLAWLEVRSAAAWVW